MVARLFTTTNDLGRDGRRRKKRKARHRARSTGWVSSILTKKGRWAGGTSGRQKSRTVKSKGNGKPIIRSTTAAATSPTPKNGERLRIGTSVSAVILTRGTNEKWRR